MVQIISGKKGKGKTKYLLEKGALGTGLGIFEYI